MKLNLKLGTLGTLGMLAAATAVAVAVPAAAHPGKPDHQSNGHKCKAHKVAYVESGAIDSATTSTLAQNSDGTWSGTLVVDVTRANHWAKADKTETVTYTFTDSTLRVRLDGGATGFTAGDSVHLIGKLPVVSKKCSTASVTPSTPAFRMIVVHPAPTPSTTSSPSTTAGQD